MKVEISCDRFTPGTNSPCKHYIKSDIQNEAGFCNLPSKFRCIESLKKYLPTLTQSAAKMFIQCREKYKRNYIDGIRPKPATMPIPIKLGTLWDAFIGSVMNNEEFKYDDLIQEYQIHPRDVAKVFALIQAFQDLGIKLSDQVLIPQFKVAWNCMDTVITGTTDGAGDFGIQEHKLSGSPDYYTHLESIHFQVGTYLLGNESWEYCDMMIARVPQLKTGSGKNDNEEPEMFQKRIYGDILKRPAFYFIGYNREKKSYGKRFWRSEFDLDQIFEMYLMIIEDLKECINYNRFYRNELSCYMPTQCWYMPIRKSGVISEELFTNISKSEAMEGMK